MSAQNHTPIPHLLETDGELSRSEAQSMTITKEGEPIEISSEKVAPQEIEVVDAEPTVETKELEPYITPTPSKPSIHPDLTKAGLQSIDTSSLDLSHKVELPISDEKVIEGLHMPLTSSFRWLAEYALFLLKHAHLNLKKIHGHVVRVIQK